MEIKKEEIVCSECGEVFDISETKLHEGLVYCESCFNENYSECHNCSEINHNDNMFYSESTNELYCEECYYDTHKTCSNCNTITNDYSSFEGEYYCEDCYIDLFYSCDNCEDVFSRDDMHYNDDGAYCDDCYQYINFEHESHNDELKSKTFNKTYHNKVRYGVEIEVNNVKDIRNGKLKLPYSLLDNWNIKEDGSLHDDGLEFTSCILEGDSGLDTIKEMCEFLTNKSSAVVDTECGLHIHFDMKTFSNEDIKKAYIVYTELMPFVRLMIAPSRRTNTYCGSIEHNSNLFKLTKNYIPNDLNQRYREVNLNACSRHGTLEIRIHQGTTNYEKIANWININLQILKYAKNISLKRAIKFKGSVNGLLKILKHEKLIAYYKKRALDFKFGEVHKERFNHPSFEDIKKYKGEGMKNALVDFRVERRIEEGMITTFEENKTKESTIFSLNII